MKITPDLREKLSQWYNIGDRGSEHFEQLLMIIIKGNKKKSGGGQPPYSVDHPTIKVILQRLKTHPSTIHQLMSITGLCYGQTYVAVKWCHMRSLVYVYDWVRELGNPLRVYRTQLDRDLEIWHLDVERPKRLTNSESKKRAGLGLTRKKGRK